jgi:hypothetical protein
VCVEEATSALGGRQNLVGFMTSASDWPSKPMPVLGAAKDSRLSMKLKSIIGAAMLAELCGACVCVNILLVVFI